MNCLLEEEDCALGERAVEQQDNPQHQEQRQKHDEGVVEGFLARWPTNFLELWPNGLQVLNEGSALLDIRVSAAGAFVTHVLRAE